MRYRYWWDIDELPISVRYRWDTDNAETPMRLTWDTDAILMIYQWDIVPVPYWRDTDRDIDIVNIPMRYGLITDEIPILMRYQRVTDIAEIPMRYRYCRDTDEIPILMRCRWNIDEITILMRYRKPRSSIGVAENELRKILTRYKWNTGSHDPRQGSLKMCLGSDIQRVEGHDPR